MAMPIKTFGRTLGDLWENLRADQCKPETEGRGSHLLNKRLNFSFKMNS